MRGRFGASLLFMLLFAALVSVPRAAGDSAPPTITAYWWEPRYPIHPQDVALYANVSDPEGVALVQATWCAVPPILCTYPTLTDPDGDGTFTGSNRTFANAEGASYEVYAEDTVGNGIITPAKYALFVDSLNLRLAPDTVSASPGQTVLVAGSAFYEDNATAPAEGIAVSVTVDSTVYRGRIDAAGSFTLALSAPRTEGSYAIDASATDRSLTGVAHGTMAVSSVPRPDLTIENLRASRSKPIAGEPFSVSFDVRNVGSADAQNARLVVTVVRGSEAYIVLNETVSVPKAGGFVTRTAGWTPKAGAQTVQIRADPYRALAELDEENNGIDLALNVASPPTSAPSPLLPLGVAGSVGLAVAVAVVLAVRRRRAA